MSLKGSSAVSNSEVPDRHRRTLRRRGNDGKGRRKSDAFNLTRAPNHQFRILNHWPNYGFPTVFGTFTQGNFFVSVPFWAILGHFLSETQAGDDPGGPKMVRPPDRKGIGKVGHSGPFWAVFGPFWAVLGRFGPPAKPKPMRRLTPGSSPRERCNLRLTGLWMECAMKVW